MSQDQLPVTDILPALHATLARHPSVVLVAPPGAGKTTGLPPLLLEAPWLTHRKILLLEPRRLAARAAAAHMAKKMGETVGETVGYRVRADTRVSARTRIEVVTEGVLTRMLQSDPLLETAGLVIFDEFHERSVHTDVGLALCLDVQEALRNDLRLLVMSATLEGAAVSRLLNQAPVLESRGRRFPVETRYVGDPSANPIRQVPHLIRRILVEENGDLLVFLPGGKEIRHVGRELEAADLPPDVRVLPLYGAMGRKNQDQAIRPSAPGMRKVVLATAIAESSLTIEGVRIVVDTGRMRQPRFDIGRAMTRLVTIPVTRDAANQRRGRAGRTGPGVCYRMWNKETDSRLVPQRSPEILNADLSSLALELALWGVRTPEELRWLDPPPAAAMEQARQLLRELNALDPDGQVSAHGRQMARLGHSPRIAHMLLMGKEQKLAPAACLLAALLTERDPLLFPGGLRDSDLRLRLDVVSDHGWYKAPSDPGMAVDENARRAVRKAAATLSARLGCVFSKTAPAPLPPDAPGILLACAYPDRIAVRRVGDQPRFVLANGRGAFFASREPLSAAPYLVAADLDGRPGEAMILRAAPISLEALHQWFGHLIREQAVVEWDKRTQRVSTRRDLCIGRAVLKSSPLPQADPVQVTAAMCDGIRQLGLAALPWTRKLRTWQARIQLLRETPPQDNRWPDVSDARLSETLDTWLAPFLAGVTTRGQLARMDLAAALTALLPWHLARDLEKMAPTHCTVPSGSRIPIQYAPNAAPVLAVRLQEMFGLPDTPTIAGGRLALTLHLLSPAGRPVQVTRDLKSFWETAYFEVRRDLKGRYPKHYWPDDPLAAAPTRRIKSAVPGVSRCPP